MPTALELLREDRTEELWQKYCGFIDLNIEQFMTIQHQLLMEQLELLKRCELGKKLLRGARPRSVEEFCQQVPITTYPDYAPHLPERREDALPEKPMLWQRTSGRSSEFSYKWVPVTERLYRELGDHFMALLLFASCSERGDIALEEHDKFLYALAPPPYASGCWAHRLAEEDIFDFLPPIDVAESMDFRSRVEEGFKMGLSEGINAMAGISVLLVTAADRFGQGTGLKQALPMLAKPRLLSRMLKAMLKAKLARRRILPKDIWSLKLLISSGTDSAVYRERIKEAWGRYPLDVYGATECVMIAMQTWDYGDMTFVPNMNLLEFMPEAEYTKWSQDPVYQPRTLLLDEVVPGERYVVVVTNFHGGPLVRYMLGDMVQITSLRNTKLNINIPQMVFYSRADNVIDFAGASLTEKVIWQAIEDSGLDYVEWVARKEIRQWPVLHLYVELKNARQSEKEVAALIDKRLRLAREDYRHMVESDGLELLEVTLLPSGAFQNHIAMRQAAGADPAWLKPPHINPAPEVLANLMGSEREAAVKV
jgi:hypothetical protein